MKMILDGETVDVEAREASYGTEIVLDDGREFLLFGSAEEAGREARQYWKDLAEDDEREFVGIVGAENLLAWALGRSAGPGSVWVNSLNDWLDLWLETPAEEWNRIDGYTELEGYIDSELAEAGLAGDVVAYQTN